jgi:hypothetical protein
MEDFGTAVVRQLRNPISANCQRVADHAARQQLELVSGVLINAAPNKSLWFLLFEAYTPSKIYRTFSTRRPDSPADSGGG